MSKLTDEIVNKGLAEFMGGFLDKHDEDYVLTVMPYTESLEALVPVWEKLSEKGRLDLFGSIWGSGFVSFRLNEKHEMKATLNKTIKQAAAYATYKAIKELER
jgi:hypothetical protein